ncbi:MAG: tetratricopeptide repeat protein, partial [Microcystaceae cyanobacterium]
MLKTGKKSKLLAYLTAAVIAVNGGTLLFALKPPLLRAQTPTSSRTELNTLELHQRVIEKFEKNDFQGALSDLNEILRLAPNDAEAYGRRGLIYYYLGDYSEALENYNKALEINPNYFKAYLNRGILYVEQKNYQAALADLNQYIRLVPNDDFVYQSRGGLYLLLRNYSEAVADFTEAIRLNPHQGNPYAERGVAYIFLKEYHKAVADFTTALNLEFKPTDNPLDRTIVFEANVSATGTTVEKSKVKGSQEQKAQLYYYRGLARNRLKDYQAALEDFNQAISLNYSNLAEAYSGVQLSEIHTFVLRKLRVREITVTTVSKPVVNIFERDLFK